MRGAPTTTERPPSLFSNTDFMLLVGGQGLSRIGNGLYTVALGLTVYKVTGSATAMGIVLTAVWLPQALLISFAGVLGDRFSRRLICIISDLGSCLAAISLTVSAAYGALSLPVLVTASFFLGTAGAFLAPAYPALMKDLIQEESLLQPANALDNVLVHLGTVVGPLAGGILFSTLGSEAAFAIDAGSFGIAAFATASLRVRIVPHGGEFNDEPRTKPAGIAKEAFQAITYIRQSGWIMAVVLLSMVANILAVAPYFVALPLIVKQSHLPEVYLGASYALQGCGGIATGIFLSRVGKRWGRRGLVFLAAIALCAASIIVLALTRSPFILLAGSAVYGCGIAAWEIAETTLLQTSVPREMLSRVFSLDQFGSFALIPPALTVVGVVLSAYGRQSLLLACGVSLLACVLAVAIGNRKLLSLDQPMK
jgi:MFS family permease